MKRFMRALSGALALLCAGSAAIVAQPTTTINGLPAASQPVACNELLPIWQAGRMVKLPLTAGGAVCQGSSPPTSPVQYQEWWDTSSSPTTAKRYDGSQWVVTGTLNPTTHVWAPVGGVAANPTATIGASAVNGSATTYMRSDAAPALPATLPALNGSNLTSLNGSNVSSGTVPTGRLPTGKSVGAANGVLESLLPIQTVTGTSKTFATADLQLEARRENSNVAMTDTFPAAAAAGMVNGARITLNNFDTAASDTITAGAGTSFSAGSTFVVPPSRSIAFVYDAPATIWRSTMNTSTAAVGPATAVANDLAVFANITGKVLADSGIAASAIVTLSDSQTLINKTISGADNTLANIGNSSLTNSGMTIAGHFISLGGTQTLSASDLTNGVSGTGAVCLASGSSCGGGGSPVSVTAAGPTIVVTPSPGTGTFTVGTQALINPQTGTTYTVLNTDMGKTITHSNASPIAVTLSQAGLTGFEAGKSFAVQNLGAGAATYTPGGGSTINGAANLVIRQNMGCVVDSDGINYQVEECTAAVPLSSSSAFGLAKVDGTTITSASGVISAAAPGAGGSTTQLNYNNGGSLAGLTSNYTGSALSLLTNTAPLANSLSLPSAATGGLAIFNTSDQATNPEYASFAWSSNFFVIQTKASGTGSARQLTLNSANNNGILFQTSGSTRLTLASTGASFAVPVLAGSNYMRTTPVAVASLTAAATAGAGARWAVTDATACTRGSVPTGGGSTFCPVVDDGTQWLMQ